MAAGQPGLRELLRGGLDVLAASISAGVGHTQAARAICNAILAAHPGVRAVERDIALDVPPWFRWIYRDSYHWLCGHAPALYGYLFDRTDAPHRSAEGRLARVDPFRISTIEPDEAGLFDRFEDAVESIALVRMLSWLASRPPGVLLHTHFLLPQAIARYQRSRGGSPPCAVRQAVCITDYEVHRSWLAGGVDRWFVASELAAGTLEVLGVERGRIELTGIPLDRRWSSPVDRPAVRRAWGLDADRFVILMTGGASFVTRGFQRMIAACLRAVPEAHVVLLAGRNRRLQRVAERLTAAFPLLRVVPFTDRVHELMGAADVLVTKPGGLTTSEALCAGLPMVLVNPIPGQEDRNADYLLSKGVAVRVRHPRMLPIHLRLLACEPGLRCDMGQRARRLARPDAADRIAAWAVQQLDRG